MDTVTIRNEINEAFEHEANTHELASLLQRRIFALHSNIITTKTVGYDQALLVFVSKFINRTPELLDALLTTTCKSQPEELCETLASVCEDFFLCPPPLLEGRVGLNGVMTKAYFCQRLVEELNDLYSVANQSPLLPLNITYSNLLAHQLIGEPFSNFLDELVDKTAVRVQEITPLSFLSTNTLHSPRIEQLESLCRKHGLLEEAFPLNTFIISQHFSCTIH